MSIRAYDGGIGGRKLWLMYRAEGHCIGRDRFEAILSSFGLVLRRKQSQHPRTTNSNHNLNLYPNLIYSLIPSHPNQIWVADITYIPLFDRKSGNRTGFCYLSVILDGFTCQIKGYAVGADLSTTYPILALVMAIEQSQKEHVSLANLIHHSDRGAQYCSESYTRILQENGISISMTQTGNPHDNPQAERINNTIKNELLRGLTFSSLSEVREALEKRIKFYNNARPHMSLGMMTPNEAAQCSSQPPKHWHSYREEAILAAQSQEKKPNRRNQFNRRKRM